MPAQRSGPLKHRRSLIVIFCTLRFYPHQCQQLTCIGVRQRPGFVELFDPDGNKIEGEVVLHEHVICQQKFQPSCEDRILAIAGHIFELTGDVLVWSSSKNVLRPKLSPNICYTSVSQL